MFLKVKFMRQEWTLGMVIAEFNGWIYFVGKVP